MITIRSITLAALVLMGCGFLASAAEAQDTIRNDTVQKESKDIPQLFKPYPVTQPVARPVQEDERLNLARRLISQKQYSEAAYLLEGLLASGAKSPNLENLLLSCYTRLGNNMGAEKLIRGMLEQNSNSLNLIVMLGEQLVQIDRKAEALSYYNQALAQIPPQQTSLYEYLMRSLTDFGFDDRAMELIDSLRIVRGDPALFAVQRGAILEKRSNYAGAAAEYYRILDQDTTAGGIAAERRLLSLLNFDPAAEPVEKSLLEQVEKTGNEAVIRILSAHYIGTGQLDRALHLTMWQDSIIASRPIENDSSHAPLVRINARRGSLLLQFITQCGDREQDDLLIQVADYMNEKLPGETFTMQANLYKAEALNRRKRYEDAVATYRSSFRQVQDIPGKADLLYRMGEVYSNGLHDYSAALNCFDSVAAYYQRGLGYLNSMQARPVVFFRMGDMTRAADGFSQLFSRFQADQEAEKQEFYLALINLANHQFDSCGARLEKLVAKYPNGMYINDAIELMLINRQAESYPELRQKLFDAVVYDWRQLPDSARVRFEQVINDEDTSLVDFALYRVADMEAKLGEDEAATKSADQLLTRFTESYYYPMALKIKADILVKKETGEEEASALYKQILADYPNYPFSTQIRKKLRALEEGAKTGERDGHS
jgi:tetratricopeptide (TPR) repeat protein